MNKRERAENQAVGCVSCHYRPFLLYKADPVQFGSVNAPITLVTDIHNQNRFGLFLIIYIGQTKNAINIKLAVSPFKESKH